MASESDVPSVETLPHCPLCGSNKLKRRRVPEHRIGEDVFGPYRTQLGLCQCHSCSFVFISPRPNQALLDVFYSGSSYSPHKHIQCASVQEKNAQFVLSVLARHMGRCRGRRLLDWGCGGGFFLKCAGGSGWDATGFDVSSEALESCRKARLTVANRVDELQENSFDAITLIHVLEHVTDPGSLLGVLKRLLAQDGRLFIEVPNSKSLRAILSRPFLIRHANFDERFRSFPIHLSYFSRATLVDLLRKHGFQVVAISSCGMGIEQLIRRPPSSTTAPGPAATAAGQKRGGMGRVIQAGKKMIKRAFFGLGLGDSLVVIARR